MLSRLACLFLLALHVSAAQYTILHRFADKGARFVPRGVVTVDGSKVSYEPAPPAPAAMETEAKWYQVAIRVGGEEIVASTPSCYADAAATFTLHFTSERPSSIEYKPSGACKENASSLPSAPLDIVLKKEYNIRSPGLAPPKVVDQTGQTVQPEPEKSFLQKYWMAICGALLVIAVMMGDEKPAEGQRAPARAK